MGSIGKLSSGIIRWIIATILVLFIAISIFWQYQYEQDIKYARDHCTYINDRIRINRTPVVLVMINMLRDSTENYKNEQAAKALLHDCDKLFITASSRSYMAHCFYTHQQKDSIVAANQRDSPSRSRKRKRR